MKTIIEKIYNNEQNLVALQRATNILKNDGIIAFPTETVYGLGANALSETAVNKIYIAKGRPSDNPLIVHIAHKNDVIPLVQKVPKSAMMLIEAFWPGAFTLVLKKSDIIPKSICAGLDTVAIRMPQNIVAQKLIQNCGFPIAAPSANTSTKPSPTNAQHVFDDLNGKIDMILDGGDCSIGIESTVVEVTENSVVILRPGNVTKEMIQGVLTNINVQMSNHKLEKIPKSPGMKYKHYSPKGSVFIINGISQNVISYITNEMIKNKQNNVPSIIISSSEYIKQYGKFETIDIGNETDIQTIAKNLFKTLRICDELNIHKIYIQAFDEKGVGIAVMNRLKKASEYDVINV